MLTQIKKNINSLKIESSLNKIEKIFKHLKKYSKNEDLDEKVLAPQFFSVLLENNEKIEIKIEYVYGHPKVPLTEKEYLKKFEVCCQSSQKKIDADKVDQIIEFIFNIDFIS